jgi:hypothetical protein
MRGQKNIKLVGKVWPCLGLRLFLAQQKRRILSIASEASWEMCNILNGEMLLALKCVSDESNNSEVLE